MNEAEKTLLYSLQAELAEIKDLVKDIHKMARETKVRMYEYIEESKQ
jgi:hypothetical protein